MKILFTFIIIVFCLISSCARLKSQRSSNRPISFELIDNRIFVNIMVNKQGPFKFIFDTGGGNALTISLAKKMNLELKRIGNAKGAGEGTLELFETNIEDLILGDINLRNQHFYIMDLSAIKTAMNFERLDGVIGYELLKEFITYINYEKKQLTFTTKLSPDFLKYFEKIPFKLVRRKPVISGMINKRHAQILFDTGDRSALTLFRNFFSRDGFKELFIGKKITATGFGIGGPILAKLSKIESLQIANTVKVKNIISRAPISKKGFNAIKAINASIGNEILKQFNTVYDYKNMNLYLKTNKFYNKKIKFYQVPNLPN